MPIREDGARFDSPWVLLCEGRGDQKFFARLIEAHEIDDVFDIRVPIIDGKYEGGRSNFGRYLASISVDETFIERVKAVLIVSDNDTEKSFEEVIAQLRKAQGFVVPKRPCEMASDPDGADVVICMIPMSGTGNLECMCLEPAHAKWSLKAELDEFVSKCPAATWPVGKQAKMRLQTLLSAINHEQPDTGFAGHWSQKQEFRIPLDHEAFDDLVMLLMELSETPGAPGA